AKSLGDQIEKVFDGVSEPEKKTAEKLQDLIRQELEQKPLDLTGGLVTRRDEPDLHDASVKVRSRIAASLPKGPAQLDGESFHESFLLGEVIVSLRLLRARLEALKVIDHSQKTLPGFGRVDAFGGARNTLFPDKKEPLDAPVRYPFIWTIKDHLSWYHWDGN